MSERKRNGDIYILVCQCTAPRIDIGILTLRLECLWNMIYIPVVELKLNLYLTHWLTLLLCFTHYLSLHGLVAEVIGAAVIVLFR